MPRHYVPVPAGAARAGAAPTQAVYAAGDNQALARAGSAAAAGSTRRGAGMAVNRDAALEAEADRAAEAVVVGRGVGSLSAASPGGAQRKCAGCDEVTVQAKAEGGAGGGGGAAPTARLPALRQGRPLPATLRQRLEPQFGADFSHVRVHDYHAAAHSSAALRARAFTLGSDIVFAPGQFAPASANGERLLAHELAHVVQQSGGAPALQGDGGLSEEEVALLRAWLEEQPAEGAGADARGTAAADDELFRLLAASPHLLREGDAFSARMRGDAFGRTGTGDAVGSFGSFRRPGSVGAPLDTGPLRPRSLETDCPTCHSVSRGLQAQSEARAAEARRREREATWGGLVAGQHEADIAEQPTTPAADIEQSRLSLIATRLQMFERVLAAPRRAPGGGSAVPDEALRAAWSAAAQAAVVLQGALDVAPDALPPALAEAVRAPLSDFLAAVTALFDALDVQAARLAARFAPLRGPAAACPGGCHASTAPTRLALPQATTPGTAGGFSAQPFPAATPFSLRPQEPEFVPPAPGTGSLARERSAAAARVGAADAPAAWRAVLRDFAWAQGELDRVLRNELRNLPEGSQGADLLEQFEYTEQLLARQQALVAAHPDALRVQAVFYPRHQFTQQAAQDESTRETARAIPWQFYLVRTPLTDRSHVPTGYTWELHDITAPRRDNRTVVRRYTVSEFEALGRERGPWSHPQPIDEIDPPRELYEELDHRDFFPEGILHWRSPITGRADSVTMHADTTFGDWLTYIGMAVAILGSLVFAPFSTPMLVAVLGGTALTAAGRISNYMERQEHGVAQAGEDARLAWDLSLDVVSALTLGLGRISTVGLAAGTLTRASTAVRGWFFLRRAQIGMGAVNIGVLTQDFISQYQAIQDSRLTPEQKQDALNRLTWVALASGAMSFVSLRADVRSVRRDARLVLTPDPVHPSRLVAALDEAAPAGAPAALRPGPRATRVRSLRVQAPDGEHTLTAWSDGGVTRCSASCPHPSEAALARLEDLQDRLPRESPHRATLSQLAAEARRLAERAPLLRADDLGGDAALRAFLRLDERITALERQLTQGLELMPPLQPRATELGSVIREGGPMPAGTRVIAGALIEVPGYTGPTQLRAISSRETDALGVDAPVAHATTPPVRTPGTASSIRGASARGEYPFSHVNDAEVKLFYAIRQHLPPNARGRIHFLAQRSRQGGAELGPVPVCSSCTNVLYIFRGDFPGIHLVDYSARVAAPTIDLGP